MRKNFTLKHTSFHFTIITVQLTMWLNYILTFTDLQVVLKTNLVLLTIYFLAIIFSTKTSSRGKTTTEESVIQL